MNIDKSSHITQTYFSSNYNNQNLNNYLDNNIV
jgi:hypothetical protein